MTKEELIKEAKNCKSVEELKELTSKNGYELSDEELTTFFSGSKEMSDDELDSVNGGACDKSGDTPKFKVGEMVGWLDSGNKAKIEWVSSEKGTFTYNALWDRKAFYYTIRPYTNYDTPWDETREMIPEYKLNKA